MHTAACMRGDKAALYLEIVGKPLRPTHADLSARLCPGRQAREEVSPAVCGTLGSSGAVRISAILPEMTRSSASMRRCGRCVWALAAAVGVGGTDRSRQISWSIRSSSASQREAIQRTVKTVACMQERALTS